MGEPSYAGGMHDSVVGKPDCVRGKPGYAGGEHADAWVSLASLGVCTTPSWVSTLRVGKPGYDGGEHAARG